LFLEKTHTVSEAVSTICHHVKYATIKPTELGTMDAAHIHTYLWTPSTGPKRVSSIFFLFKLKMEAGTASETL